MNEVRRIIELYSVYGSIRQVSKKLNISRNTVKKYLDRVQEVQKGIEDEILPTKRQIRRQCTVVTREILYMMAMDA